MDLKTQMAKKQSIAINKNTLQNVQVSPGNILNRMIPYLNFYTVIRFSNVQK